jgi:subtilisin family serine protease
LFVAAAGNNNDGVDFSGNAPSSSTCRTCLPSPHFIKRASQRTYNRRKDVDLAASGHRVKSVMLGGQRVRWSGTSMASPHVANAAAKLFELNSTLTVEQVREILISTATKSRAVSNN